MTGNVKGGRNMQQRSQAGHCHYTVYDLAWCTRTPHITHFYMPTILHNLFIVCMVYIVYLNINRHKCSHLVSRGGTLFWMEKCSLPGGSPVVPRTVQQGTHVRLISPSHIDHQHSWKKGKKQGFWAMEFSFMSHNLTIMAQVNKEKTSFISCIKEYSAVWDFHWDCLLLECPRLVLFKMAVASTFKCINLLLWFWNCIMNNKSVWVFIFCT